MRSPKLLLLAAKEFRELMASRAYWLLLLIIGPLVGQGFIAAVNLYAEVSGSGGGPAALPQALSPLDGILVPTFGAYDLAVTLLFLLEAGGNSDVTVGERCDIPESEWSKRANEAIVVRMT